MNLAERAITSAKVARLTAEARDKIGTALGASAEDRESLLIESLNLLVEALGATTDLLAETVE